MARGGTPKGRRKRSGKGHDRPARKVKRNLAEAREAVEQEEETAKRRRAATWPANVAAAQAEHIATCASPVCLLSKSSEVST